MTLCNPEPEDISPEARKIDLPEGVPPLRSFYLYLTNGCNLRCRHCWIVPKFVDGQPSPDEYLDLELLKQAVAEAKPLGLRSAKLTGGEPTLHPQFVEIADYLTAEGLSLTMETNGTLIDAALARHLKNETNITFVSVSIDGPKAEVHDPFRGIEGSFDAAVRGFRALAEAGYRPQLIMSLHKGNKRHVQDMVELARDLGAGSVKFNPVICTGRGTAMHKHDEVLTIKEIVEMAHFVRGDLQRQTSFRLFLSTPLALYTVSELVDRGIGGECHVRRILGILGSGEMALCGIGQTIPELCFGKLGETSIKEVWFSHPTLQQMRRNLDAEYPGICRHCIHAKRCLTYCIAQNYQHTGRLVTPYWLCDEAYRQRLFPADRLKGKLRFHIMRDPDPGGIIPIHASAVEADGGAWIFLGPSSAGKSTICRLLGPPARPLADDRIYIIPRGNDEWAIADASERVLQGPLSEQEAASLNGVPLHAIFRLYQDSELRLEPISSSQTCHHLMNAFFDLPWHTKLSTDTKKIFFAQLASLSKSIPGYHLHFRKAPGITQAVRQSLSKQN